MIVCKPCHLIEHDVTDTAIGSFDVKEAKTMLGQRLLNIVNVGKMYHFYLYPFKVFFTCSNLEVVLGNA